MDDINMIGSLGKFRGLAVLILELFEKMLSEKEIVIPDEDRTGAEEEANLFGMAYAVMEDQIADLLTHHAFSVEPDVIQKAEQCLIDNGIKQDEESTVLQAIGYILFSVELYPSSELLTGGMEQ